MAMSCARAYERAQADLRDKSWLRIPISVLTYGEGLSSTTGQVLGEVGARRAWTGGAFVLKQASSPGHDYAGSWCTASIPTRRRP